MKLGVKQRLDYVLGGLGIFLLRPTATVLGNLLRRDHEAAVKGATAVVKMLGGGSLVIALPALLGFRRTYPNAPFILITTAAVKPFAEVLAVFDEILVIDDKTLSSLFRSAARLWRRIFLIDTILDFEVYSRLTTVLSTLTCARNRIGFYLENTFWRERLATHLVFFNRFAGSFHFYESAVAATGAKPVGLAEAGLHVARSMGIEVLEPPTAGRVTAVTATHRICIAPACSDLGKERMLAGSQWARVLPRLVGDATEVAILGGPGDRGIADSLIVHGKSVLPEIAWINACDGRSLRESLNLLAGCARVIAIDSSILHFARLFGIPSISFWGPTDPVTRLKQAKGLDEEVWYEKVSCSPCIHVAETPPCQGKNICIEAAVRRSCGEATEFLVQTHHLQPFAALKRRSEEQS
jgi:ADP-heptose:LPS heptosyltransferase